MNYYPQYGYYQQPQNYYQQQQLQMAMPSLYGKIVDGIEVVKATDVPLNQTGIFPRADLGELYVKAWQNDGTTRITTFVPVVEQPQIIQNEDKYSSILQEIQSSISALSKKVDGMKSSSPTPMTKRRKEADDDE